MENDNTVGHLCKRNAPGSSFSTSYEGPLISRTPHFHFVTHPCFRNGHTAAKVTAREGYSLLHRDYYIPFALISGDFPGGSCHSGTLSPPQFSRVTWLSLAFGSTIN